MYHLTRKTAPACIAIVIIYSTCARIELRAQNILGHKTINPPGCMDKDCLYINEHLTLGAIVNPPFLYECAIYNRSKCENHRPGIEVEVLLQLATMLNFTFTLLEAKPPEHSNMSSPETLLDDLDSGRINMSASFMTIRQYENTSIVYSQPVFYYRRAFLMKTPKMSKIEFLLTQPFSPMVWLCFITMVASYFIALTVIAVTFKDAGKYSNISHNAWTILASLVKPVSSHRYKQHAAVRALMISWQLGKMIILSLYSASLVGFIFIAGEPSIPFNSTRQLLHLVKLKQLNVVMIKGLRFLLAESKNTSMEKEVLESLNVNPPLIFNNSLQAVQYVSENSNVILGGYDRNLHIWVRMYNVCDVSVITDYYEGYKFMGYPYNNDFRYSEQIQRTTAQLAGSFYMQRLYDQYVGLDNICEKKSKSKDKGRRSLIALTIAQLQGTFWVLACGAFTGTAAVIGELILYAKAQRKLRHRHNQNVQSMFY